MHSVADRLPDGLEPPSIPVPVVARLCAPSGPPRFRLFEGERTAVVAVPGLYCVTYLIIVGDDVAVVDVGSVADLSRIESVLSWLGRLSFQIRFVIPTHLHFDHVMGMDPLARRLGVPVAMGRIAHENVTAGRPLRWLSTLLLLRAAPTWIMQGMPIPSVDDLRTGLDFGFPWGRNRFTAELGPALDHGQELPGLPGWTLLATPGHADDAICLYHEEAGFLIAGDTIRNYLGGEWNHLLCDPDQFEQSRSMLLSLHVETVFPAHGPALRGPGVLERLRTLPWFLP